MAVRTTIDALTPHLLLAKKVIDAPGDVAVAIEKAGLSREELEKLAESQYPAAPIARALLDRL